MTYILFYFSVLTIDRGFFFFFFFSISFLFRIVTCLLERNGKNEITFDCKECVSERSKSYHYTYFPFACLICLNLACFVAFYVIKIHLHGQQGKMNVICADPSTNFF